MALVYDKYFQTIPSSYKVTGSVPIDLRQVVLDLSNLYGPISKADYTWENDNHKLVTYTGMLVTVKDTQEVYMCIDGAHPYESTSWKRVGGSNATITAVTIGEYPGYITVDNKKIAVEEIDGKYYRVDQDEEPREEIDPSIITFETVYAESEHTTGSDEKGIVIENPAVHKAGTYIKVEDEDGTISYSMINIDALLQKIQELQVVINDVSSRLDNTIVDLSTFKEYVDTSLADLKDYVNDEIEDVSNRIADLSTSILNYIDEQIEDVSNRITDLSTDIYNYVGEQINIVNSSIINVSTRVKHNEEQIADISKNLDEYIDVLNDYIADTSIKLENIDASLNKHEDDIKELNNNIADLGDQILNLEEHVDASIEELKSVDASLDNKIEDVSLRLAELEIGTVDSISTEGDYIHVDTSKGDVTFTADVVDSTDQTSFPSRGLVTDGYVEERLDVFNWVEVEDTENPPVESGVQQSSAPIQTTMNLATDDNTLSVISTGGDVTIE